MKTDTTKKRQKNQRTDEPNFERTKGLEFERTPRRKIEGRRMKRQKD